jgi:membrane-associated phospholipid phosphatase
MSTPVADDARRAAAQVVRGRPAAAARRWLGFVALGCLVVLAGLTVLVASGLQPSAVDLPLTRVVQRLSWGPLQLVFQAIDAISGPWQIGLGVVVIIGMSLLDRRAGMLMVLGAGASALDQLVKVTVARSRPGADLVTVLTHPSGFSFPSGHAVFFSWVSFMMAVGIAPLVRPRWRPLVWGLTAFVIVSTCLARVWAGAHWTTDVIGGVALGLGWAAFILWLPERWLPSPPPLRRRAPAAAAGRALGHANPARQRDGVQAHGGKAKAEARKDEPAKH